MSTFLISRFHVILCGGRVNFSFFGGNCDRELAWSQEAKRWWKPAVSDKQPLCHGSNAHVHNGVDVHQQR